MKAAKMLKPKAETLRDHARILLDLYKGMAAMGMGAALQIGAVAQDLDSMAEYLEHEAAVNGTK